DELSRSIQIFADQPGSVVIAAGPNGAFCSCSLSRFAASSDMTLPPTAIFASILRGLERVTLRPTYPPMRLESARHTCGVLPAKAQTGSSAWYPAHDSRAPNSAAAVLWQEILRARRPRALHQSQQQRKSHAQTHTTSSHPLRLHGTNHMHRNGLKRQSGGPRRR